MSERKRRNPAEPFPVRSVELVNVFRVTCLWGEGVDGDPIRQVTQYFDPETGIELFKYDEYSTWKAAAK